MKLKNKQVGAKVIVDEITVTINPSVGWKTSKRVPGTIVPMKPEYEQYYHTCSGGHTHVRKHIIKDDAYKTYAIKLDNNVTDIEWNNIIVVREWDLKFLERLPDSYKQVSKVEYNKAMKLIEKYKYEQTLR